jgi:hypothetical protein
VTLRESPDAGWQKRAVEGWAAVRVEGLTVGVAEAADDYVDVGAYAVVQLGGDIGRPSSDRHVLLGHLPTKG